MICYLTHNQIDKQRWDECIAQSPDGLIYCWSWYLDVVHPGWEALVEDDYENVMPLAGGLPDAKECRHHDAYPGKGRVH